MLRRNQPFTSPPGPLSCGEEEPGDFLISLTVQQKSPAIARLFCWAILRFSSSPSPAERGPGGEVPCLLAAAYRLLLQLLHGAGRCFGLLLHRVGLGLLLLLKQLKA